MNTISLAPAGTFHGETAYAAIKHGDHFAILTKNEDGLPTCWDATELDAKLILGPTIVLG